LPPEYTFVPWLRRGVAAEIAQDDTLGTDLDTGPAGRATLPVELTLATVAVPGATVPPPAITRDIAILGPGDVANIKNEAILRTQPTDGAVGVTPGELAYVEFYDEDFPWRYTPARAATSRLRPWLALLVLTNEEFTVRRPSGELPVLTPGPRAVLPPITETWAWAHAQLSRVVTDPTAVDGEITGNPDHALSRIMSPRRLVADTAYHAFLVPVFEAGRLASLGRDASTTPVQRPAWGTPAHAADGDLPVYFEFSFTTGALGDFETLARLLQPAPAGERFGKRPLDISDPGFGMSDRPNASVELEGALAPPEFDDHRVAFADVDGTVKNEIEGIVDATENRRLAADVPDDPLVVPPVYGRWHADVPRVADATTVTNWLTELNLDIRNRAAAGLGVEVVRERQEEYMQRAWEQVGEIEAANQRLREAELARGAADTLHRKHVAQAGADDRILILTSAAHAGLPTQTGATESIRGSIEASPVPVAAQSPAFRRITRPQRPLMRRLTGSPDLVTFQAGLLTDMNAEPQDALSAAPPAADPAAGVDLQTIRTAVNGAAGALAGKQDRPDRVFMAMTEAELIARLGSDPSLDLDTLDPSDLSQSVVARATAAYPANGPADDVALGDRVKALAAAIDHVAADPPNRAIVTVGHAAFELEFGDEVAGKTLGGLTVRSDAPGTATDIVAVAGATEVQSFANELGTFSSTIDSTRVDPPPPLPLAGLPDLPAHVVLSLAPALTIGDRLASALPVIAGRAAADHKRLAPVMAYPVFDDPLFDPLRELSQDHIIPNVSDLPRNSLTVLEPNRRFIESFLAGVNQAFMAELLWREYPTDQRGSSFTVFWDTSDAPAAGDVHEIIAIDQWSGDLGEQAPADVPSSVLVLVIRGDLLVKYPKPVVYAQQAMWPGGDKSKPRVLDPAGETRQPILRATLDPDIMLVGFDLGEQQARGHRPGDPGSEPDDPGWFFVIMERPGQPRFGLDDDSPSGGLQTWNDLAWDALTFPGDTPNIELVANSAVAPAVAQPTTWGRTAADMAAILFQQPVLLARHASEMLP
jgi:hypothetical protein